jgi:hypothetical protein
VVGRSEAIRVLVYRDGWGKQGGSFGTRDAAGSQSIEQRLHVQETIMARPQPDFAALRADLDQRLTADLAGFQTRSGDSAALLGGLRQTLVARLDHQSEQIQSERAARQPDGAGNPPQVLGKPAVLRRAPLPRGCKPGCLGRLKDPPNTVRPTGRAPARTAPAPSQEKRPGRRRSGESTTCPRRQRRTVTPASPPETPVHHHPGRWNCPAGTDRAGTLAEITGSDERSEPHHVGRKSGCIAPSAECPTFGG